MFGLTHPTRYVTLDVACRLARQPSVRFLIRASSCWPCSKKQNSATPGHWSAAIASPAERAGRLKHPMTPGCRVMTTSGLRAAGAGGLSSLPLPAAVHSPKQSRRPERTARACRQILVPRHHRGGIDGVGPARFFLQQRGVAEGAQGARRDARWIPAGRAAAAAVEPGTATLAGHRAASE